MQAALQRSENDEKGLQGFILNKSPKALSSLIAKTWKMQASPETVVHEHCTQISTIRNHAAGECAANCQGKSLKCAKEALQKKQNKCFLLCLRTKRCLLKRQTKKIQTF